LLNDNIMEQCNAMAASMMKTSEFFVNYKFMIIRCSLAPCRCETNLQFTILSHVTGGHLLNCL